MEGPTGMKNGNVIHCCLRRLGVAHKTKRNNESITFGAFLKQSNGYTYKKIGRAKQGIAKQGKARQGRAGQSMSRRSKAAQGKAWQGKARRAKQSRQGSHGTAGQKQLTFRKIECHSSL